MANQLTCRGGAVALAALALVLLCRPSLAAPSDSPAPDPQEGTKKQIDDQGPSPTLIAHWPLKGDAKDVAGGLESRAQSITFGPGPDGSAQGAAIFDGRRSVIEVADSEALHLGKRNFSVSVWVKCQVPMRGVFGDVLSKFDPQRRRGINFYIAGSSPAYCGMSDTRHVHFGIDDGYVSRWEDCGKPWPSNSLASCLIVFDGQLYCGNADADKPEDAAHVFRWAGGKKWIDCGRLGNDPNHLTVMSMIVQEGKLYAGTGIWDWIRARGDIKGVPPAAYTRVFVYEGGTKWRDLGQVGQGTRVLCLGSFNGELYAGLDNTGKVPGRCYKYDGRKWIDCGSLDGRNFEDLMPIGGALYGSTHGNIYRYEGGRKWTSIGQTPFHITQIHCMQVAGGKLYVGTWPQGYALRYEGDDHWTNTGRLGLPKVKGDPEINEINALTVYNGKLYAGVIPKAEAYRYESDGNWTLLGSLGTRPDWAIRKTDSWCRLVSLTCFQGKLFGATGSCRGRAVDVDPQGTLGRVYAMQAGQVVSHEHGIGGQWTHLAAVRQARQLRLYVSGQLSASSEAPEGVDFDLTNTEPLKIGFGQQAYFMGAMADLRIYAGALEAKQVKALQAAVGQL